jgi:hypothetical protein
MATKSGSKRKVTGHQGLSAFHNRVLTKVARMSLEKRFDYMVAAGIYTSRGKLTKQYGG